MMNWFNQLRFVTIDNGIEHNCYFGEYAYRNELAENKGFCYSSKWSLIRWLNGSNLVSINIGLDSYYGVINDVNKLLFIYNPHKKDHGYIAPNNAVIYNVDGSIHKILTPPVLTGDLASRYDKVIKGSFFGGLYPSWFTNSKAEKVIGIAIMFPPGYHNIYGDFFEVREINLETGEFGEVLQDGAV